MSIFTNWIFWVVLSSILFVFALIGFLTDKKRKNKTNDNHGSDKPILNSSNETLNSDNTANSFNLASPVQEEVGNVFVPSSAGVNVDTSNQVEVNSISEPAGTSQNHMLDVSGNLSFGDDNLLNGDNMTLTNGNVQMSGVSSLGDDFAVRNQVNLNTAEQSNNQGEATSQSMQPASKQANLINNTNVNELSNVFETSNTLNYGQNINVPAGENMVNVNGIGVSGEVMMPGNMAVNTGEIPNGTQGDFQAMPANNVVNTTENTDNLEKIYDTWS